MTVRLRVRVTGRVQGVGFRDFVRRLARGLGLSGYVRNEPDGSVTAEVEGEPATAQAFVASLRERPPHFARIDHLDVQEVNPTGESGFRVTG